jgi:hypothetical protein
VAIAALAVWAFTAGAGAYLLTHVIAAKRAAAVPAPGAAGASSAVFPALPRTKVTAGPDDHPLREFSHPALALAGLGCWLAFTATDDLAFGWLACGALAATAGIGLSWFVSNARSASQRQARQAQARRHEATGAGGPAAGEPGTGGPGAGGPGAGGPGAGGQAPARPGTGGQGAEGHGTDGHTADEPRTQRHTGYGPSAGEPGTDPPGAGEPDRDQQRVPAHLVTVHGLAAATTIGLVLATIVTAAHP